MGMDLCYYGVKEEDIPKILDGNFDEDFTNLEHHTLRALLFIFKWERIRRGRFSRKK